MTQCPRVPPHSLCSNAQIRDELLSPGPGPSTITTKLLIRVRCQETSSSTSGLAQSSRVVGDNRLDCVLASDSLFTAWIHDLGLPRHGGLSSQLWDTNKWTQYATAQLQTCHQLIDSYQFVQLKNVFTLIGRAGKIKFLDIHLDKTRYK